jgi:hypothetical protein
MCALPDAGVKALFRPGRLYKLVHENQTARVVLAALVMLATA